MFTREVFVVVVIAAGAVGGVPSREVDPVLVVVAGADVDVLGERDDRNGLAAPRSPRLGFYGHFGRRD